jgi:hypothetical protein
VAAVVGLLYAAILLPRLASPGGVYTYVHIGHRFLTQAHSSHVIKPTLPTRGERGFDGQFYFFMAADPAHAKDYMDMPAYRWSRIVYPFLARGLSGGDPAVVPYMLLFVNLVAIAAGTLGVAIWLRRRRVSPWFALLYGLFPGLAYGVVYDIAEPLAFALVVWGMVAFDSRSWRRLLLSAGLFATALLTRETVAIIPGVMALSVLVAGASTSDWLAPLRRNFTRAAVFAAVTFAPMLAWRFYVPYLVSGAQGDGQGAAVRPGGFTTDTGEGLTKDIVPLHGIANLWPWNNQAVLVFLTVIVPGLATLFVAGWALRRKQSPELWIVVLSAAVFVLFIPTWMLVSYGNGGRVAIGVLVPLVLALPVLRQVFGSGSRMVLASLLLWSVPFWAVAAIFSQAVAHPGKPKALSRPPSAALGGQRPQSTTPRFAAGTLSTPSSGATRTSRPFGSRASTRPGTSKLAGTTA